MNNIPWIDASIILIYLFASFAIGLFASRLLRRGTSGEEGYFLAGRKMPGWMAGTSVGVTSMNADVAPAYAGMAVVVGLPIAWFYLSRFGLGLMIVAILFAYRWRRMKISTAPEFYRLRFGGRGGTFVRIWTAIWSISVGMVPWIGAGLLGLHMLFGPVFGFEEKWVTLAVVLPILLLYVWISGYAGVVITDMLQSLLIVVANVVVGIAVLYHFGGPTGLTDAITNTMGDKSAEILSTTPVPGHRMFGPLVVMAWFLATTIGVGGSMQTEGQRVFSCRNERESMKAMIWSEAVLFLMLLSLTLPVLGLIPLHPEMYMAEPAEREQAYGMLLNQFLPVGLLGLALAGLTASVMSTIDSHLNYGAQIMTNDVARVFKPQMTEKQGLLFGKFVTVAIMVASIAVVYFSKSLIDIAVTLLGLFGSTLAFAWGQWWWWRVNFPSWVAAMVVGPIIYLSLTPLLQFIPWWEQYGAQGHSAQQVLGMLQAVIGMAISTFVWIATALVTRPEKMSVLMDFYKEAHPMGHWGPVRRAIIEEEGSEAIPQTRLMIPQGFGVAIMGTTWICLSILSISQLYVGFYMKGTLLAIAAIVVAIAFKFVFSWYFNRLEQTSTKEVIDSEI